MKRLMVVLAFVVLFIFTLSVFPVIAQVVLSVGSNTTSPGSENVAMPVNLDNSADKVKGLQFEICEQPNYLTIKGCESTDRASSFSCLSNELENGCARIIFYSVGELITEGIGQIMTIYYDVSEEASRQCINLAPSKIIASDENRQPLSVESEAGELCTDHFTLPIIDVRPSQVCQSRWTPLPYLMTIIGQDIKRETFVSLEYYPSDAIISFPPIVWSKNYIWSPFWVLPGFMTGMEEQTVTVSVLTEEGILEDEFNILPIGFASQPTFISIDPDQGYQEMTLSDIRITAKNTTFVNDPPVEIAFIPSGGLTVTNITIINNTEIEFDLEIDINASVGLRSVVVTYDNGKKSIIGNNVFEVRPK